MNPTPFFNPFTNRPDLAATALVVAMIATVALVTFACPVRAHADTGIDALPDAPAVVLADIAPQVAAEPAPADVYQFGGWVTTGLASGDLAFGQSLTFVALPPGMIGEGLFGFAPTALLTRTVALEGVGTTTDATLYCRLGESDSYALLGRVAEGSEGPAQVGVCYWLPVTYTDEANVKHKPLAISAFMGEGGIGSVEVAGRWPLPTSATANYQLIGSAIWEPEGDSRGSLEVRHLLSPAGDQYVSIGAVNLVDQTHWFIGFGSAY